MPAELPYELWQYIAGFLDMKTLDVIFLVNRTLFSAAQSERYKTMSIGPASYLNVPEAKNILRAPPEVQSSITRRVKHLVFSYGESEQYYFPKLKQSKIRLVLLEAKHVLYLFHHMKEKRRLDKAIPIFNRFIDSVPALSSVSVLTLDFHLFYDNYCVQRLEILHASWPIIADNLRSLSIKTRLDDIPDLLPKTKLNRLETLAISLQSSSATFAPGHSAFVISNNFIPFIATHSGTIQDFSLDIRPGLHFSAFRSIPRLPLLRKFTLSQCHVNLDQHNFDGFLEFLSIHRSNLQHFEINIDPWGLPSFPSSMDWFSQPWQMIAFPSLRVLKLSIYDFQWRDDICMSSIALFQHHIDQLSELKFHQRDLPYSEIAQFFTVFKPSNLQVLSLTIMGLSDQLFRFLAEELPDLKSLQLTEGEGHRARQNINSVVIHVYRNNDKRLLTFCKDIQNTDYSRWKLHSLAVEYRYSSLNGETIRAALRSAIPSLCHLDTMGRISFQP
ncbi:hypothetical protein BDN70DRAFT_916841 [Pholiota conissans]|uniref:F-box domain-containing protein n=1 Tax=Pholiota conissans TaxID=109636 RepID=A0A9P6CZY6_9AGAR|nr:hypothetical protein BDN70DRAFT_916841 [Pholiota conissans]